MNEKVKEFYEIYKKGLKEGSHPERYGTTLNIKIDMNKKTNQLLIGLLGTDNFKEVMKDAMILKKHYKHMGKSILGHSGFLYYFKKIKNCIYNVIKTFNPKSIIICGFSLGGSIGLIFYDYIKINFPEIEIKGYGFGIPKVFSFWNKRILKEKFKDFQLIENKDDVFPMVFPICYKKYGKVTVIGKRKYFRWFSFFTKKGYMDHLGYYETLKEEIT